MSIIATHNDFDNFHFDGTLLNLLTLIKSRAQTITNQMDIEDNLRMLSKHFELLSNLKRNTVDLRSNIETTIYDNFKQNSASIQSILQKINSLIQHNNGHHEIIKYMPTIINYVHSILNTSAHTLMGATAYGKEHQVFKQYMRKVNETPLIRSNFPSQDIVPFDLPLPPPHTHSAFLPYHLFDLAHYPY